MTTQNVAVYKQIFKTIKDFHNNNLLKGHMDRDSHFSGHFINDLHLVNTIFSKICSEHFIGYIAHNG